MTPPDDGRAAAVGDRGDVRGRAPLQQPLDVLLRARASDEVGRVLEARRGNRARCPGRTCRARARRARAARRSRSRRARTGSRRGARASRTSSSATGCSGSPSSIPRRSESAGTEARACSALGCWSSLPHPQCLRRPLLTAASLCSGAVSETAEQSSQAPEILARGPWEMAQITARWLPEHYEPSPEKTEAADEAIRSLQESRIAEPRRPGGPPGRLQPGRRRDLDRAAAAAVGAAARRRGRLAQPCRALRHARRRRPLARRAARPVGVLLGRAAGRSAPAAPSTSARARPTRSSASWRRSGRSLPSASRARRCCDCPTSS